jgi:iduronate 2-sulfatase
VRKYFSLNLSLCANLLLAVALIGANDLLADDRQPNFNVLMIAVDDLRPQLGCYGQTHVISPNIDKLAEQGLLFERAYCQQAICMSSRASLLSGYRPDKGDIFRKGPLAKHVPGALSMNKHFMANGYETISIGKIYHHKADEEQGWSRPAFHAKGNWQGRGYLTEEAIRHVNEYTRKNPKAKRQGMGPAFESADVPDDAYADGIYATRAISELNRLKGKPFFLAVGFVKPHLPFNSPKKYWDLYKPEQIKLADNPFSPKDSPAMAFTNWGELRGYHGMPRQGKMPDDKARQLIHGYLASVSYADAMIGRVLDELDRLNLRESTVVVLWGDHGWKLGEHGMWCKHTNFEIDTHVPLIVSAPKMKARGKTTRALVEFVDIYPTLCELCGLQLPDHLEGLSTVPLLDKPELPWKKAALSQYPRGKSMGRTMRTARYRYTEWQSITDGKVQARELYDHDNDPGENVNIVAKPENAEQVARLSELLGKGWKGLLP